MRRKEGDLHTFPPNPDPFPAKRSFRTPNRKRGACLWVDTANQLEPGNARKEKCESPGQGTEWPFL